MKRWALIEGIAGVLVLAPGATAQSYLGQQKVRPDVIDESTGLADWHKPVRQVVAWSPDIARAAQKGGIKMLGVLLANERPAAEAFMPAAAEHGAAPRKVK